MLNPGYRDILSAFTDEKVEYLLVGAYALAAHGFVRATGDIDLWIRPSVNKHTRPTTSDALLTYVHRFLYTPPASSILELN